MTVIHRNQRLDEKGPDALVPIWEPVNGLPEFVGDLVRTLKAHSPTRGDERTVSIESRIVGIAALSTTVEGLLVIVVELRALAKSLREIGIGDERPPE